MSVDRPHVKLSKAQFANFLWISGVTTWQRDWLALVQSHYCKLVKFRMLCNLCNNWCLFVPRDLMPNIAWHCLYTASVERPCPDFEHIDRDRVIESIFTITSLKDCDTELNHFFKPNYFLSILTTFTYLMARYENHLKKVNRSLIHTVKPLLMYP